MAQASATTRASRNTVHCVTKTFVFIGLGREQATTVPEGPACIKCEPRKQRPDCAKELHACTGLYLSKDSRRGVSSHGESTNNRYSPAADIRAKELSTLVTKWSTDHTVPQRRRNMYASSGRKNPAGDGSHLRPTRKSRTGK